MNKEYNDIKNTLKKALANYLGIETDDIEDDFSLTEDLHMKPTDITDFSLSLSNIGIEPTDLDFTQIETFADLVEASTEHV